MSSKEDRSKLICRFPEFGMQADGSGKCGLERPTCANCAKAGRVCEGYQQYPVFLNRTLGGPVRRVHLEEAKETAGVAVQSQANLDVVLERPSASHDEQACTAIGATVSSRPSWESHVIAWFWESYAPSATTTDSSKGTSVWLYHAVELAEPTLVLQQALRALSITRYGRVRHDQDIIRRGHQIYCGALHLLQNALYDQELMWNDETLASVRALVLYELFESTLRDPSAWYGHLGGVTTLLQARGPRRHSSVLARTVLEDIRYALMLKAIMLRKASVFGQEDWIDLPWKDRVKSRDQKFYDHGFRFAAIAEKADLLAGLEDGDHRLREIINVLQECNDLQHDLEQLFTTEFKPFLQAKSADWAGTSPGHVEALNAPSAAELNQLMIVLNLWACQLLLGVVAEPLRKIVIESWDSGRLPAGTREHARVLCNTCADYANQPALTDLASAILRYMPLVVTPNASEFATSRTLFPLTCILWQFRYSGAQLRQTMFFLHRNSGGKNIPSTQRGSRVVEFIPLIARDAGGLLTAKG